MEEAENNRRADLAAKEAARAEQIMEFLAFPIPTMPETPSYFIGR